MISGGDAFVVVLLVYLVGVASGIAVADIFGLFLVRRARPARAHAADRPVAAAPAVPELRGAQPRVGAACRDPRDHPTAGRHERASLEQRLVADMRRHYGQPVRPYGVDVKDPRRSGS